MLANCKALRCRAPCADERVQPANKECIDTMKDTYSRFYLWYVVAILTLASTFSIIDRQILNIMIGPVKRDLGGISDFQVSLIMGFAFTFLYSVLSYPAGRIADRYSRKNLMVAGIASWSLLTMVTNLLWWLISQGNSNILNQAFLPWV